MEFVGGGGQRPPFGGGPDGGGPLGGGPEGGGPHGPPCGLALCK